MSSPVFEECSARSRRSRLRAVTGVLPVLAAVALVGAALVVALPGVRTQANLSLTREPTHYVELYVDDVATARSCPGSPSGALVDVRIRSHLREPALIGYRITLDPSKGRTRTSDGAITVLPGEAAEVRRTVPRPVGRDYLLRVELPAQAAALQFRCRAGGTG